MHRCSNLSARVTLPGKCQTGQCFCSIYLGYTHVPPQNNEHRPRFHRLVFSYFCFRVNRLYSRIRFAKTHTANSRIKVYTASSAQLPLEVRGKRPRKNEEKKTRKNGQKKESKSWTLQNTNVSPRSFRLAKYLLRFTR